MPTTCPKCSYLRKSTDTAPDWQCPNCGVAYNKVGAAPAASQSAGTVRSATRTMPEPRIQESDELRPVTSAPSLFTLNGFGFKLYGSSDEDMDNGSYMTTHYLVFFFLPFAPVARYRVIRDGNSYAFLGKGRLRTMDKVHLGIAALLILWFCIAAQRH